MALTVVSDCTVTINVSDSDPLNTIATAGDLMAYQENDKFNFGGSPLPTTGFQWSGSFSLASTTMTLDLTALSGPRGSTVTFASVRILYIFNTATGAGFVLVVGGAANPFTPNSISGTWAVNENSPDLHVNSGTPWVVDGTHKTLKFDSGAHTVTFKVIIIGS